MNMLGKFPNVRISSRNCSTMLFEPRQRPLAYRKGFRDACQYFVSHIPGQRFAYAARHNPSRVNTLAPKHRDYLLTPFSKRDTVLTQRWPRLDHANDVPLRRIGVHAEEQVR